MSITFLRYRLFGDAGDQGRQVVASHGDVLPPINRGLNSIKDYFLSKIMYGFLWHSSGCYQSKIDPNQKTINLYMLFLDEAFTVFDKG